MSSKPKGKARGSSQRSYQPRLQMQQAANCRENAFKKHTARYLLGNKQQTYKVRGPLVNIVEHLATGEPDSFLTSRSGPKTAERERLLDLQSSLNDHDMSTMCSETYFHWLPPWPKKYCFAVLRQLQCRENRGVWYLSHIVEEQVKHNYPQGEACCLDQTACLNYISSLLACSRSHKNNNKYLLINLYLLK